jgi:hypothetical protein
MERLATVFCCFNCLMSSASMAGQVTGKEAHDSQ